jgi:hypothetical protein
MPTKRRRGRCVHKAKSPRGGVHHHEMRPGVPAPSSASPSPSPVPSLACEEECVRQLAAMLHRRLMGVFIVTAFQQGEALPGVHFGDHGVVRLRRSVQRGHEQHHSYGWYVYVQEHTLCGDQRVLESLAALLAPEPLLDLGDHEDGQADAATEGLMSAKVVKLDGKRCRLLRVF